MRGRGCRVEGGGGMGFPRRRRKRIMSYQAVTFPLRAKMTCEPMRKVFKPRGDDGGFGDSIEKADLL